jgi:hypothetical protein
LADTGLPTFTASVETDHGQTCNALLEESDRLTIWWPTDEALLRGMQAAGLCTDLKLEELYFHTDEYNDPHGQIYVCRRYLNSQGKERVETFLCMCLVRTTPI